ncbi:MAG: hypothetical protein WCT53_05695, partial [Candidatus Gracilibacteria bacterium]
IIKLAQRLNFDSSINTVQLLLTYVDLRRTRFGELTPAVQKTVEAGIKAPVDRLCGSTISAWRALGYTTAGNLTAKMRQSWDAFRKELIAASEEGKSTPFAEHNKKIDELEKNKAAGKYNLLTPEENEAWKNHKTVERLIAVGASRFHAGIRTIESLGDEFNYSNFKQAMRSVSQQSTPERAKVVEETPAPNRSSPSLLKKLFQSRVAQLLALTAAIGTFGYTVFNRSDSSSDHTEFTLASADEDSHTTYNLGEPELVAAEDLDQPTESKKITRAELDQQPKKEEAPKIPFSGDYTIRGGEGVSHATNFFSKNPDLRKAIFDNLIKNPNSPEIAKIRTWLQKIGRMDKFEDQVIHSWVTGQIEKFAGNMMFVGYTVNIDFSDDESRPQLKVFDVSGKSVSPASAPSHSPAKIQQEKTIAAPSLAPASTSTETAGTERLSAVRQVMQGLRGSLDLSAFDKQPADPNNNPINYNLDRSKQLRTPPPPSQKPSQISETSLASARNASPFGPTASAEKKKSASQSGVINIARITDVSDQINRAQSALAPLLHTLSQIPYGLKFKRDSKGCFQVQEGFFGKLFGTKGQSKQWKQFLREGDVIAVRAAELMDDIEDLRVNG